MKKLLFLTLCSLLCTAPTSAQQGEPEYVTPTSIVAASSADEWVAIDPDDLLVMQLAPDGAGNPRTVVIQLIPAPFSQPWVANIRTLARAEWWDGTSVNRVQDNYVTQWGDVTEEKPLPEGVTAPEASYAVGARDSCNFSSERGHRVFADCPIGQFILPDVAVVGGHVGFEKGWPLARAEHSLWPIHCYGYVGVGRGYAPDTGTGAELYTVIGQPQRHMDRNLAVIGRVIEGMQHLSSLPRGSGELGFYTEEEAHLRVPIISIRLGSELADAPSSEYLSTDSESFAQYVHVRANRNDSFYRSPAGGVDICNVEVPVRRVGE
ncbi:peptidylprolyl isomerase [Aurantiacibacter sp. MUD61]|uniref:peptidylprolyl isomerase n=1 Tax=Aurantiacibacter sp. MUD61 TaxID=3009083 RepID=UPI0022F144D6|nr:peptidylprolyl isomerase [Aurantiacibacter sp. MUD61]